MLIGFQDYNGAGQLIATTYQQEWADVAQVLTAMPLHLKASDEAGIQGSPIFDPIGTNEAIMNGLVQSGTNQTIMNGLVQLHWRAKAPIPPPFNVMGKDVDFAKNGVLVEVQFSNYPFVINNVLRSEMFYNAGVVFDQQPTGLLIVVTKAKVFPASQSTLYFEQAKDHLDQLVALNAFRVPVRLVALGAYAPSQTQAVWTQYAANRTSRTVVQQVLRTFNISAPAPRSGRATII